jgi:hypothetical protein
MTNALHTARSALLGLATALLLTACSSSPPKPDVDFKPDYDFSQVKTIAFYHRSGQVSGDNPMQLSDIQRGRIDEAIAFALKNKGYRIVEDASQADMLVSWHLATQQKTDVRTYETPAYGGYGYGPYNRYSMYSCWSCMPTRTEVSVHDYTEGTFIVDMIDPQLRKSVWRSVVQSKLKGKVETDQGKYNAAAERILADFPPM